jgi:hypothetical protein
MCGRAIHWICEGLGYGLCEAAFRTGCRRPFAAVYRAGCWFYGKADEIGPA